MGGLVKGLFGGSKTTPAPPVQPATQVVYDTSAAEAAKAEAVEKQRRAAALAKGRASTVLTGGLGLTDPAPVLKKILGG